jgi:hypothetical protein
MWFFGTFSSKGGFIFLILHGITITEPLHHKKTKAKGSSKSLNKPQEKEKRQAEKK